jgi:hypothetical protein
MMTASVLSVQMYCTVYRHRIKSVLFGNVNAVFRWEVSQVEFREYMFRIFVTV